VAARDNAMIAPHTERLTRRTEGLGFKLRRHSYETKKLAISQGQNPILYPADFVQYLLDRQAINSERFEMLLGHDADSDYFRSDVFNTVYNDGNRPLPRPLREKLAGLTHTDAETPFWKRHHFHTSDADTITIDTNADISALIEKHKNAGGRFTRAQNKDAILDAHIRGL
jgi:hypothetical protein